MISLKIFSPNNVHHFDGLACSANVITIFNLSIMLSNTVEKIPHIEEKNTIPDRNVDCSSKGKFNFNTFVFVYPIYYK